MSKSKISQVPNDRSKPYHEGVLLVEGIPHTTKDAFKATCAKNHVTMRDIVIQFMRDYSTGKYSPDEN